MARTGDDGPGGISAFVVEKGTPGLSFGANEKKMGWNAQPTRAGDLRGRAACPAANRLGAGGHRLQDRHGGPRRRPAQHRRLLARRRAGGARQGARLHGRAQGVRPARSQDFQALQFRLADMATELEAPRTLLWRAASALDAKAPEATQLCAMAKRFATDAGFDVANQALQLHGGYGYLADYGWRRSCATCGCTRSWKAPTRSCG